MADAVQLASAAGNTILNVFIMLFSIVILGAVAIGGFFLYRKKKRYGQFKCIIWERDGFGQITETSDRAGIFVDGKTKNKRFFLKKANVGLDPDNVPYISRGGEKFVYLIKTGLKNFQFVKPRIRDEKVFLEVGEEDVNWAVNSYERQKKVFGTNALLQYLPFIALGFVSMIILIVFIYFFRQFGVLKDVAIALQNAAEALAQASGGTVVLQ